MDYTITFINSDGCERTFDINAPLPSAPISPSFEQTVVLSCNDSDNAEFLATATGGFLGESEFLPDGTPNPDYDPNYNDEYTFFLYDVDPEINTTAPPISVGPVFENLSLGTYYVMVSDALGCEVYDSFEVGAPPPIQAITTPTNPSCSEDNESFSLAFDEFNDQYSYDNTNLISDGAIEIEVSGGQGPYTFTVFNSLFVLQNPDIFDVGDGVYNIYNLAADTYFIQITDSNGCLSSGFFDETLDSPPVIDIQPLIDEISCNGGVGDIQLDVSGGTLPFLTPVQPTGVDPDGINTQVSVANSYMQTGYFAEIFVDANGCQSLFEIIMDEPEPIDVYFETLYAICDDETGSITILEISGETPPYTIEWLGISSEFVPIGSYAFVITDASGCQSIYDYTINSINGECESIKLNDLELNKSLIKVIDVLGKQAINKGFQLHIYDDGSVEKKYLIK